ncbi:hypothetical protein ACJRO7_035553 [Eucalyptus globulus]|uniref:Uncharacterized protein n=1 Tax=Eucalyptus globulus TaxID=34317 RepID=A0ABD3JAL9_EUCGL
MEVYLRFVLAWCLLATMATAPTGCHGAGAASEAGNTTIPWWCDGLECLIAYQQPKVELMAVLDPEHALGSSMLALRPGDVSQRSRNPNQPANCGRTGPGRYTPCVPKKNYGPRYSPFNRGRG